MFQEEALSYVFCRTGIRMKLCFHLTQNGNAISFDKDLNQWADLGDCLRLQLPCSP